MSEAHIPEENPTEGGEVVEFRAAALPATAADLTRKSLRSMTLNDHVEPVFLKLFDEGDNPVFHQYLAAVSNADSVEGSVFADDILAAQMIRDAAPEKSPIKAARLVAIRNALNVVLRRYGISRNERRYQLGGEIV